MMTTKHRSIAIRALRLLGALVGLSVALGGVRIYRHGSRDGERSRRLSPASSDRDRGSQPLGRDLCRPCRGGLSASQRADVIGLAQTWVREGTGAIVADVPVDTPNAQAAASAFREIRSLLAAAGVPSRGDYACITIIRTIPRMFATIRLSYPRIAAVAGPCGLWPEDLGPSIKDTGYFENREYHNFGCAYQRNIAAMIDNPSDLVQPRPETPAYTARRTEGFEKYRKGNTTTTDLSRIRQGQTQRHRQMISNAPSKSRRSAGHRAAARGRLHRAGASRVGAGLLRDRGNRSRRARGGRGPPPQQGPSLGSDGRHGGGHRSLSHRAYAERDHPGNRRPAAISWPASIELATVCDAGTRVVVIGSDNDVAPYRELVRRGVNDYVIGPVETLDVVRSICSLFSASEAVAVGRIIAVVGAKGGVGASTVAHNVAWAIARDLALDSVVIDLDLAFGTAGLDYNKDPLQGIANAVFSPDRPDTAFIDACWRNAPTISACWRRRRRSIGSTISARRPSMRSSIRCA